MPTFDVVSKTDLAEVDNALANMTREMSQRYDFKNSIARIERNGAEITLNADDDLKLKQMHELLQGHLARRKVDARVIDYKPIEKAAGQAVRQKAVIRQGIDRELAKRPQCSDAMRAGAGSDPAKISTSPSLARMAHWVPPLGLFWRARLTGY